MRSSAAENMRNLAAEVERVRKMTGAEKIVLVGNSRGANVIRDYIRNGGGAATVSRAVIGGGVNHGVWAGDYLPGSEFNGKGPFMTALNSPQGPEGLEVTPGVAFMTRLVGAGALVALLGTFFSVAYASSRQFYHLAQAGYLPRVFGTVNARHAPAIAVYLVAVIALATAAFAPNNAMVVFIFLISVSHVLLLAAFLRLRRYEPAMARPYRALGGSAVAAIALLLSLAVMVSCYQLEVSALRVAIVALLLIAAHFVWLHPGRPRAK